MSSSSSSQKGSVTNNIHECVSTNDVDGDGFAGLSPLLSLLGATNFYRMGSSSRTHTPPPL